MRTIAAAGMVWLLKLLAVSAVAAGVHTWLSASGPVLLAVAAGIIVVFSVEGLRRSRGALRIISCVFLGAAVFGLVAQAVVVPLGAYLIWLDLAADGEPAGAVSFVFVLFSTLFAAATVSMLGVRTRTALASLGAWALIVASLVSGIGVLLAPGAVLLALALARNIDRRSIVVVFAASLGALVAGPNVEPAGSGFVDRVLAPGLRAAILEVAPRFPLVADVPGYGHRLDSRRLGGTPLLSGAHLYTVEGPPSRAIYFRTEVFTTYDGSSWEFDERVSDHHPDAGAEEARHFSPYGEARNASPPAAGNEERAAIRLQVVSDFVGEAAHTLDTVRVEAEPSAEWRRYSTDTGFVPERPLVRGTQLRLYEAREGSDRDARENGRAGSLSEPERYLQLPDNLPEEVKALGRGPGRPEDADERISRIRRELTRDAVYTLSPPETGHEDFVAGFLETRKGYCVQFATSFTVLARAAGLPARYVTGYRTRTDESGAGTVTGLQAHAWSEVFVEGRWHTVEATPPMLAEDRAAGARDRVAARSVEIADDSRTRRQLEHMLGVESNAEAGLSAWVAGVVAGYGRRIAVVLSVVAMGAAAWVGTSTLQKRARAHRKAGPLSKDLLRLIRRCPAGTPDPRLTGWRVWARECAGNPEVPLRSCHVNRIAQLALSRSFGRRRVRARDRRYIRLARRYLKRRRRT